MTASPIALPPSIDIPLKFSMVSFVEGSIDPKNLNNYYIKQIK